MPEGQPIPEASQKSEKPKSVKKKKAPKEEDLKYIYYFYRPVLIEDLWKDDLEEGDNEAEVRKPVKQICASGHYCYALCDDGVYAWGLGENYVLGNRKDDNEFSP